MRFRKAVKADIDRIISIIRQAQSYFKENEINQWQNNYPNAEIIEDDIIKENSYVLLKDNIIIATVALSFDGEKTYDVIYDGQWLSSGKYGVIHRIAVDAQYKGLGMTSAVIGKLEEICCQRNINSIKVDTHEKNLSMQKFLCKNGFLYCGIIYLEDNSKRIAFEKTLC